jgi:hypothetical protein
MTSTAATVGKEGDGGEGDGDGEEDDAFNSWESSWNQLIEGVGGSPVTGAGAGEETDESLSPVKESKPSVGKQKQSSMPVIHSTSLRTLR